MKALRLALHKRFGASSEKATEEVSEQVSLFNETEVCASAQEATEETTTVAGHVRREKREYTLDNLPDGIPVEVVEHRLSEEERTCPQCGCTMTEIGVETVRRLKAKPAQFYVQEDRYYSYACQNCKEQAETTPVVKTPHEKSVIPSSFATPEAIAHIMVQKFAMGVPLYRQEQELRRMGISLSRQTMSNWILKASEDYLKPVWERLHEEMLSREILYADETTLQVLKEPGKSAQAKSYMWLYHTGGDTNKPIVLCEYQPSRNGENARAFLSGFKGYLHTDGYSGYHSFSEDITVVGCWAHTRRKFGEAVKSLPKGKKSGSSAAQGLAFCDMLFKMESDFAGLTPEQRYEQRLKQEKPVLDALLAWAECRTVAPKSALGKAMTYLKDQWPYLTNYLKDGRLELSNNRAERGIKPFVIDRKNFLFANTPGGAKGSAVMFSLIQTALSKKVVCILDEAHLLEKETLEEFRFLLTYRFDSMSPLALVLVGQTELWDTKLKLQRYAAIRQRIDLYCVLPHLDRAETEPYIRSHLDYAGCPQEVFTEKAVDEIFKASTGIPRMINRVCEKSLMYSFQKQKRLIDDYMVKFVVEHVRIKTVTD